MELISILSTKTLSTEQRHFIAEAGITIIEQDFIEIKNSNVELNNIKNNLIFSSQNAVLSLINQPNWEQLQTKNIFCVGIKSKELLEQNGFKVDVYIDYASELAEIITLIYNKESFTFFSGNLRKETLPKALKEAKINFNEIEVYQTTLAPYKISKEKKLDGILFFSPSGVESFLTNNKINNETCFCIGETTAEALKSNKINNIVIAESPTIDDVIAEVLEYYKN